VWADETSPIVKAPFDAQFAQAVENAIAAAPLVLGQSAVAVPLTGTTVETALATIIVPANAMGPNGRLRIQTTWTMTNGVDDKFLKVRFSTITGTQYMVVTATTSSTFQSLTIIANRGATNSQVSGGQNGVTVFGAGTGALVTSAVDTTAATTVVITGQLENAVDTMALESYLVELLPG
jgi:hypothetical protein